MSKLVERKDVEQKYKWNLNCLVNGDTEWEKQLAALLPEIDKLAAYQGKLADDAVLLRFFRESDEFAQKGLRLYLYAVMNSHTDMRDKNYQEKTAKIQSLMVRMSSALSFSEPEICKRTTEQLLELSKKPEFSDYSYSLEKLSRTRQHVLSDKEEKILAETGNFTGKFKDAFGMFNDADVKFGTVTVDGKEVELSHGTYSVLLQDKRQDVRKAAFEKMYDAYKQFTNTIATVYSGNLEKDWFYAKVRGYNSCLERALSATDVDVCAYNNLLAAVNEYTPVMHDYIALRKKLLKLDTLNMYDLYVSIVDNVEFKKTYEEAFALVKQALAPLGGEYAALLDEAYNNEWIDVKENVGKRSGAYSWGTYGVHPYVLLNYQQTTHDIFTIAHELGHAMHSHFSQSAQPFAKADYEIFVAEIASTVNEVLMLKYLLKTTTDKDFKKFLLSYYLDMFRTTLFRQTMFAEFELAAHQLAEQGKPISAEGLSDIYYGLNQKYYGPAVVHNEQIRYEWSRIPHFYNAFYVYQYSTGITAAVTIASDILARGEEAFKNYKKFLSAGGSMPPVDILKLAGVDMTTTKPFEIAMKEFKDTLDQLKEISK